MNSDFNYYQAKTYECDGCVCLNCDFIGDCHCVLKNSETEKPKILLCDNYLFDENKKEENQ